MTTPAQKAPKNCPKTASVFFEGRRYPLIFQSGAWRLRSRSKSYPADFWTGLANLKSAQAKAKEWLEQHKGETIRARKGGGTLEALAAIYLETPKRTKANVAKDNVSRLRSICRAALGKELSEITCREVTPDLWQRFQRVSLEKAGREFNYSTRYRENIAINAATRAARSLFLPLLIRAYRAAGLDVRDDAGQALTLPEPYVPPSAVDDDALTKAWAVLPNTDRLWLVIGLARFGGLRLKEIEHCRISWIEEFNGVAMIGLRDRLEEGVWTKTGKPYRAQIINPALSEWLLSFHKEGPLDKLIVPDPSNGEPRSRWFERAPQAWLRTQGITAAKPLHRLRGLYADHIAKLTADAVAARLAAVRAAQENLGHTTAATTEKHYLSD